VDGAPVPCCMREDLAEILFDEETIHARLDALARQIESDYWGGELTVVVVLQGGMILMADLLRRVGMPLLIETLSVASYHGGIRSRGELTIGGLGYPEVRGRQVLLLDDVLDTGLTLGMVKQGLLEQGGALSVRTCVLLCKRKSRRNPVEPDYIGFSIGDEFVVGYGLDYNGRYRNLPYIGVLKSEVLEQSQGR